MSLCTQGFTEKISGGKVTIQVEDSDPLIILGNLIDWTYLMELIKPDLKRTEKGCWWLGRKLRVRIHLAVLMLQMLFKWTDRETERLIKTSAMYQIFSGIHIISRWSCPDHTKIETFRNRLSEGTYKKIADYIVQLAVSIGLADSSKVDIDFYSSRGQCVLSFRRQFDETFVRQVLQTFRISQVKGDGLSSSDANDRYKENFRASQEILFSIQEHLMKKKQEVFSAVNRQGSPSSKKQQFPFKISFRSHKGFQGVLLRIFS